MVDADFWLRLDADYMWYWECCDSDMNSIARSACTFFFRKDAVAASVVAKRLLIQTVIS